VELPQAGSVVGPTLNCLIGEQFKSNKFSDRYFYELGGQPHSFSAGIYVVYLNYLSINIS